MEEMLEVMKKQLKMQKLISGLLAVMLVILLIAGGFFVNRMSQMTAAMSEAADNCSRSMWMVSMMPSERRRKCSRVPESFPMRSIP